MPLLIGVLSSALLAGVGAAIGKASPQLTEPRCSSLETGTYVCGGDLSIDITPGPAINPREHDRSGEPRSSVGTEIEYRPYRSLVNGGGPGGATCWTKRYYPLGVGDPRQALIGPGAEPIDLGFEDCPARPAEPGEPETPSSYAASYWREVPLPSPEPWIAPGRAITGLYAYLETQGTTTHTYTEPDTPFGPLTITATGSYHVDWGDGTQSGPHPYEGGPWPDGRIRHEYIDVGTYDVTVTERWTATWSFGAESGTLEELRTAGAIEDFPVQQIQAVILR